MRRYSRTLHSVLLTSIATLLCAVPQGTAGAQTLQGPRPGSFDGSLRFGLESTLFAYETMNVTAGDDLFALELDRSLSAIGVSQFAGVGPLFGYGLSDDVILTARVVLSRHSDAVGEFAEATQFRLSIVPAVEYLLGGKDAPVVPFVGGAALLLLANTPMDGMEIHEVSVGLGPQAGAHVFISDSVSLDPAVLLVYRMGTGSGDISAGESIDVTVSGFAALLTLGLSVWM